MQEAVVEEARRWIGTPYRHRASCCGAGADCLGLVRGVWRALLGAEPETLPPYSPHWQGEQACLVDGMARHFHRIDPEHRRPGDVLVFRPVPGGAARHCAILSGPDRIIHAYWGRSVAETAFLPWWRRRVCAAFRFPETRS